MIAQIPDPEPCLPNELIEWAEPKLLAVALAAVIVTAIAGGVHWRARTNGYRFTVVYEWSQIVAMVSLLVALAAAVVFVLLSPC